MKKIMKIIAASLIVTSLTVVAMAENETEAETITYTVEVIKYDGGEGECDKEGEYKIPVDEEFIITTVPAKFCEVTVYQGNEGSEDFTEIIGTEDFKFKADPEDGNLIQVTFCDTREKGEASISTLRSDGEYKDVSYGYYPIDDEGYMVLEIPQYEGEKVREMSLHTRSPMIDVEYELVGDSIKFKYTKPVGMYVQYGRISAGDVMYNVDISVGEGGVCQPSGKIQIPEGQFLNVAIAADKGYTADKVIFNGEEIDIADSVKTSRIDKDSTLEITFKKVEIEEEEPVEVSLSVEEGIDFEIVSEKPVEEIEFGGSLLCRVAADVENFRFPVAKINGMLMPLIVTFNKDIYMWLELPYITEDMDIELVMS